MKRLFIPTFLFFLILSHAATAINVPEVTISRTDDVEQSSFFSFKQNNEHSASIAAGDLGRDGIAEIVTGSGFGVPPEIKLFRQDGSFINSFLAYDSRFNRGIHVAIGDVDGNGVGDIVTGTAYGGGPHIRVFDGYGNLHNEFFAYNTAFRGGAFVTTRDINNDGKAEIITGAGPTGGSHVRVFRADGALLHEFFAFEPQDISGVTVGTINIDGKMYILAGRASSDPPTIKIFTPKGKEVLSFEAFEKTFTGGVTAIGSDTNNDGKEEIIVAPNGNGGSVKIFDTRGNFLESTVNKENTSDAIKIAATPFSKNAKTSIITISSRSLREGPIAYEKYIRVDLSEQRLYAYEHGLLANSFLISSGINRFPTPPGEYEVQRKVPIMDYRWNYGPGNPANYNLPNVKYNLQFRTHYYLHYAYWHNNFGKQMSHGCVNMPLAESEWIYHWAEVGTPVVIQE